jgi:uncharacterized repeat protein (TIGR03806 family)
MDYLTNKTKVLISISIVMVLILYFQSCKKDDLLKSENNIEMSTKLSDYNIFQGNQSDLIPANGYELYEISTQLFSDYAEKQRLIKIPVGSKMTASNDGLPDFPEGTIIVKTFYYFNDKRDISKGKKIIETRLLIKNNSKWNVGTYPWNNEQTDGNLLTTGINKTVNWVNESGTGKVISFHIPGNRECATCHKSSDAVIPIGAKIRNLNIDVIRNGFPINQLTYFQNIGILNSMKPASFSQLPSSHNTSLPVSDRARAYLDVNCAHCHNQNGNASGTGLYFDYDLSLDKTHLTNKKNQITNMMSAGDMPRLGTTIIDEESLALIKAYIESL